MSNLTDSVVMQGYSAAFLPKYERFTYEVGKANSVIICDESGFRYGKDCKSSNNKGELRWNCQKRKSRKCKVIVKTLEDFIVFQKYDHTCN